MARLNNKDYTYVTTVRGMCRGCRRITPARVYIQDGKVWQQSLCPTCATSPAMIAGDADWYMRETLREFPDRSPLKMSHPASKGCPHDCGALRMACDALSVAGHLDYKCLQSFLSDMLHI